MIRSAGIDDIEAILKLEETLFDNAMGGKLLLHELTRGRGWVYSEAGGHYGEPIEGYILIHFDNGPLGLIDIIRLGVAPEAQRKGIGAKLLEHALWKVNDAMLTVKKDNAPAIKLYRRFGFEIVAHLAGAGAFVMRRRVTSA